MKASDVVNFSYLLKKHAFSSCSDEFAHLSAAFRASASLNSLVAFASLSDGFVNLSDGFASLSDGFASLSDGFASLSDGFANLSDGFAKLSDGFAKLSDEFAKPSDDFAHPSVAFCASATLTSLPSLTSLTSLVDIAHLSPCFANLSDEFNPNFYRVIGINYLQNQSTFTHTHLTI